MSERLRAAFREAADSAPVLGDPVAARHAADQRRSSRWVGSAVAVAVLVGLAWAGGAHVRDGGDRGPSNPPPVTPRISGAGLGQALLYRSCSDTCRVGVLDDTSDTPVRPGLADWLAEAGLDGVSLSPDGLLVAIPRDGALTVTHVFSQPEISVTVPAGADGSDWRPYFWSRGDQHLVIAQWSGGTVTALGAVHVGYGSESGTYDVRRVTGEPVVPTDPFGVIENLVPVQRRLAEPTTYQSQAFLVGPSMYQGQAGSFSRPWSNCLLRDESLLGREGARTSFIVADDTSTDQRGATVVYRSSDATPVTVANGQCDSAGFTRYALPISSGDVKWRLLGPLDHSASLMTRDDGESLDLMLVSDNAVQKVGQMPIGSQVVAPGMTGGFFG